MTLLARLWTAAKIWRHAWNNPKTPAAAKWLPFLSAIYLISPIDLIPDLLPILGQLDDIGIIVALCTLAFKLIPTDVKQRAKREFIDVEPVLKP